MSLANSNQFKVLVNITGIDQIVTAINDLNSPITDNTTDIALLDSRITNIETENLEPRTSALEASQLVQDATISGQQTQITNTNSSLLTTQSLVNSNTLSINNNSVAIGILQTSDSNQTALINTNATDITTLEGEQTVQNNQIAALQLFDSLLSVTNISGVNVTGLANGEILQFQSPNFVNFRPIPTLTEFYDAESTRYTTPNIVINDWYTRNWTLSYDTGVIAVLLPEINPDLTLGYNVVQDMSVENRVEASDIVFRRPGGTIQPTILDTVNNKFLWCSNQETFGRQFKKLIIRARYEIETLQNVAGNQVIVDITLR